jgi:hypothetical protein
MKVNEFAKISLVNLVNICNYGFIFMILCFGYSLSQSTTPFPFALKFFRFLLPFAKQLYVSSFTLLSISIFSSLINIFEISILSLGIHDLSTIALGNNNSKNA